MALQNGNNNDQICIIIFMPSRDKQRVDAQLTVMTGTFRGSYMEEL